MQTLETSFHFAVGRTVFRLVVCLRYKSWSCARNSENSRVFQREEVKPEKELSVIERALIKQTKQVFSPCHCPQTHRGV